MNIVYTKHAKEQIQERNILEIWVEEAVKRPDYTIREGINKYIIGKKINNRIIEVVYVKEKDINIITVYWI